MAQYPKPVFSKKRLSNPVQIKTFHLLLNNSKWERSNRNTINIDIILQQNAGAPQQERLRMQKEEFAG